MSSPSGIRTTHGPGRVTGEGSAARRNGAALPVILAVVQGIRGRRASGTLPRIAVGGVLQAQNANFRPNCICRGGLAPVIWPKVLEVIVVLGFE